MDADRHSPIDSRRRRFLTLWCFLLGLALLPIPAIRAVSPEFLYEALAGLSPDVPVSKLVVFYAWLSLPIIPLIPVFLAWSLPGADRPGLPKRSIVALCLLIACHPLTGQLSYSKARSLTRVVTPLNEAEFLEFAQRANAQQVQQRCSQVHNSDPQASTRNANRLHDGRYLSRSINEKGKMVISIELPVESGELVMKATSFSKNGLS